MPSLTASLSDALIDLSQGGACPADGVEVGSYFSVDQLRRYRARLPDWRFTFHPGNVLNGAAWWAPWRPWPARRLRAYLDLAPTPSLSCHLTVLPLGVITLALRAGLYLPMPGARAATRQVLARVQRLREATGLPIVLENMPMLPDPRGHYRLEGDPAWITQALAAGDCRLLLDLGHARICAAALGMDAREYVGCLPLERVVQIHVSGPRPWKRGGMLFDAHEPLQEVDCELLEWTLARTKPQIVTLEYFRDREPLREQLARLRSIVSERSESH